MKRIIRYILAICLFIFLPVHNSVTNGQTPSSDKDLTTFLVDRIFDTRKKVNNFKCTVVYHDYRPKETRQRQMKELIKQGAPQKIIDRLASRKKKYNEYRIEKQRFAFDNQGRARVHRGSWISDTDGKPNEETSNRIWTWDGKNSIEFGKIPGNIAPYATLSNKQPFETTERIRQPWQQYGGDFCLRFAAAIASDAKINVTKEQDGSYRVEVVQEDDKKEIAIIDPSQGYSIRLQEIYIRGQLRYRCKANFTEVSTGVWFPDEGEDIRFSLDDPPLLQFKSIMKVTGVTINDPNFYEGLFHIDFPKGTRVRDVVSGLQYVVGVQMSEKMYGISDSHSLDEVAMDTLEEIAKDADDLHQEVKRFIPKASVALEEVRAFILSIAEGRLVNPRNKPESEESNNFLKEFGMGDIAWDGEVVAVRGAKVLTVKQESKRPLKLTKDKWTSSYKLPEKVQLPYSMLVVNNEGANYLMKIIKIESGGITVSYRKLNPDELSQYKQESEDSL